MKETIDVTPEYWTLEESRLNEQVCSTLRALADTTVSMCQRKSNGFKYTITCPKSVVLWLIDALSTSHFLFEYSLDVRGRWNQYRVYVTVLGDVPVLERLLIVLRHERSKQ